MSKLSTMITDTYYTQSEGDLLVQQLNEARTRIDELLVSNNAYLEEARTARRETREARTSVRALESALVGTERDSARTDAPSAVTKLINTFVNLDQSDFESMGSKCARFMVRDAALEWESARSELILARDCFRIAEEESTRLRKEVHQLKRVQVVVPQAVVAAVTNMVYSVARDLAADSSDFHKVGEVQALVEACTSAEPALHGAFCAARDEAVALVGDDCGEGDSFKPCTELVLPAPVTT